MGVITIESACAQAAETKQLLKQFHYGDSRTILISALVGCTIQALILGSCAQMTYHYLYQPKRDRTVARFGAVMILFFSFIHLALANGQTVRLIMTVDRATANVFIDWWFLQLEALCLILTLAPTLVFFAFKAYHVWDKSKLVLASCLGPIFIYFAVACAAGAYALPMPAGFKDLSNDQFAYWLPRFFEHNKLYKLLSAVAAISLLVATSLLTGFICAGIWRHRSGYAEVDQAITKIVRLCCYSLLPMVTISACFVAACFTESAEIAIRLSRVCIQIAPPIYLHGLMTSLVSRERVAHFLSAEPVRNMAGFDRALADSSEDATGEKYSSYSNAPAQSPPTGYASPAYPSRVASSSTSSPPAREATLRPKLGARDADDMERVTLPTEGYSQGSGSSDYEEEKMRRGSDAWGLHEFLAKGPNS